EEAKTVEAGFTAVMLKPIEPSRLLDRLRVYCPATTASVSSIGRGRRLLIVDDDPVQLKLARLCFEHLGYDVVTENNVADALRNASAKRPDVVLSDVLMPKMDGFQLCLELRRDRCLADVPVVLLTAWYETATGHELAGRVGANELVVRTPDFGVAAGAVARAL